MKEAAPAPKPVLETPGAGKAPVSKKPNPEERAVEEAEDE